MICEYIYHWCLDLWIFAEHKFKVEFDGQALFFM